MSDDRQQPEAAETAPVRRRFAPMIRTGDVLVDTSGEWTVTNVRRGVPFTVVTVETSDGTMDLSLPFHRAEAIRREHVRTVA